MLQRAGGPTAPNPTSAEAPGASAKLDVDQLPPIAGESIGKTEADQANQDCGEERKSQSGSDKPCADFARREKHRCAALTTRLVD
jgi:hypothetical protein